MTDAEPKVPKSSSPALAAASTGVPGRETNPTPFDAPAASALARSRAAATAATTAAAASTSRHSLATPVPATSNSTLHNPLLSASSYLANVKRENTDSNGSNNDSHDSHSSSSNSARTPLTPPPAYRDFLRSVSAISPDLTSPLSGTSGSFCFSTTADPSTRSPVSATWRHRYHSYPNSSSTSVTTYSHPSDSASSQQPRHQHPTSLRPTLTTHSCSDGSITAPHPDGHDSSELPISTTTQHARSTSAPTTNTSPAFLPPPRPAAATHGAGTEMKRQPGTLRRPSLVIPPSPSSAVPAMVSSLRVMSPTATHSPQSAASGSTNSASGTSGVGSWSSVSCSPSPVEAAGPGQRPGQSTMRSISVRHVITRTVTFSRLVECPVVSVPGAERTNENRVDGRIQASAMPEQQQIPLVGQAPKGKRRKVEESGSGRAKG